GCRRARCRACRTRARTLVAGPGNTAAHAGARDCRRAAVSGVDDSERASLSPRLTRVGWLVSWLAGSAAARIGGRLRRERWVGLEKVKTFETQRRKDAKKIKGKGTAENTECKKGWV